MKDRLFLGDITGALQSFLDASKPTYLSIFNSLADRLPQLVTEMQDIEMIYLKDGVAKYRINRAHDIGGSPATVTYYIYFVLDKDGLWRIDFF